MICKFERTKRQKVELDPKHEGFGCQQKGSDIIIDGLIYQ